MAVVWGVDIHHNLPPFCRTVNIIPVVSGRIISNLVEQCRKFFSISLHKLGRKKQANGELFIRGQNRPGRTQAPEQAGKEKSGTWASEHKKTKGKERKT